MLWRLHPCLTWGFINLWCLCRFLIDKPRDIVTGFLFNRNLFISGKLLRCSPVSYARNQKMEQNTSFTPSRSFASLIGMIGKAMAKSLTERMRNAGYEMNMEHWIVLVHLWQEDGQNQAKLGQIAGRHKTAVTRAIDNLEELNYVLRVPDQNDRRNKLIYLTKAGKELEATLMPMAQETHREALADIPEEELAQCQGILRRILTNVKQHL